MKAKIAKGVLSYPKHLIKPEDFLRFVELDEFTSCWSDLGLDVEDDLWALQIAIMADPDGCDIISGTGGLRKIRFRSIDSNKGKSGSFRVCFAYFPDAVTVLLVAAYAKNQKIDLSEEEKAGIKHYLAAAKTFLSNRKVT